MNEAYGPERAKTARRAHLVASVASLMRPVMAVGCAIEAIVDAPASIQTASNVMTEASDMEGKIVRTWSHPNYKRGEVRNTDEAARGLMTALRDKTPLSEWILSLDGRWLDERTDKWSQNIRRFALLAKGKLGVINTVTPIVRDELISNGRELYAELGVDNVAAAGNLGKLKTVVMGAGFICQAAVGDRYPRLPRALATAGSTLAVVSLVDYAARYEQAYQTDIVQLDEEKSYGSYALEGLARICGYTQAKRQQQLMEFIYPHDAPAGPLESTLTPAA